jgi:hypothetical protein
VVAETNTGRFNAKGYKTKKIELEEGEKILGIKCRQDQPDCAYVYDLQFVLGKLV